MGELSQAQRETMAETQTTTAAAGACSGASEHPLVPSMGGRELVGRYQVLELIGAGGSGEVYAGLDPQLERPVAIKRLRADVASSVEREQLAHEARINARLEHPNIVRVYDFLTVDQDDYIVSEYIDGSSLAELMSPERRDVEGDLALALALSRGLAYAHSAGVVHLDLKAENVLIGRDGVPKIADFGIAQRVDALGVGAEQAGAVIRGTFRSMSPEQTLASAADIRSDLFSFGTLLYELFGGVSPFQVRGNPAETIRRIREHHPLPLSELRAEVPAALSELVQELHRKDPAERPRSARDVEAVLSALLERRARQPSAFGSAAPPVERRLLSVLTLELEVPAPSASMERTERYLRAVTGFHASLRSLVEQHEGRLLSAFGARAVVCLGHPRAHDNNCERAARLVLAARAALAVSRQTEPLRLRAGLDVGEVLLLAGCVAGPPLAGSAALCDAAAPGELLVSSRAQRILRRCFAFEPRGAIAWAGAPEAPESPLLQHHALIESSGGPSSARAVPARRPMIGRELELGALFEALRRSSAGSPSGLLLLGSAGIGKTRLLSSFCERLAESSYRVLALGARPEDQYCPFAPFSGLLTGGSLPPPSGSAPRPSGPDELGARPDDTYRQRMIAALIGRLLASARGRGLVLVLEDVHWLDRSSFELLAALQRRRTDDPVLLVLSGRPECAADVSARLGLETLTVPRLTPTQALEIVQAAAARRLSHREATRILELADGLPLLLEELALATAEGHDARGAAATPATGSLHVPSSLTESLDRRLELLGVARECAELLAALGRETPLGIVERASELPARELAAQLARLSALGLLVEEGEGPARTLRFRHGLVRDAIYERLPLARREQLHRRIASAAESRFGAWLAERPDLFAPHFARSGQWLPALELRLLAGEQAARKSCHFEACAHLYDALELLARHAPVGPEHDRWELAIRRALCPSLNASDGWAAETVQANNARLAALGAHESTQRPLAELWAMFAHALLRHDRRAVAEALALLDRAEPSPARDAVRAVARGNLEFYLGELALAERSLRDACQRLADEPTRRAVLDCGQELLVEGPCYLAWIYAIQGLAAPCAEQRREAEASPEPLVVARAFGTLFSTALGVLCREHQTEALRAAQQARVEALLELSDLLRHPIFRAVAEVALGRLRLARGERDAGLALMRHGYELYEQSGTQLCLAEYAGFVAEAHLGAGEVAVARGLIERAREAAAHPYCGFYRPEFLRIEAEISAAEGELGEARQLLEIAARACAVSSATEPLRRLFSARVEASSRALDARQREHSEVRPSARPTALSSPPARDSGVASGAPHARRA